MRKAKVASVARDVLVFSIKLESGEFSSDLRMPIPLTEDDRKKAVERWLDFIASGLRLNAERMDATFQTGDKTD